MDERDPAPALVGPALTRKAVYCAQEWGATGTHSRSTYSDPKARDGQVDVRLAKKEKVFQAEVRVSAKAGAQGGQSRDQRARPGSRSILSSHADQLVC